MNKFIKNTYAGINKDLTKSKFRNTHYYDARNMRLFADSKQDSMSISNTKGNTLRLSLSPVTITPSQVRYNTNNGVNVLNYVNDELKTTYNAQFTSVTSGIQKIIGSAKSTKGFILFSTDNNGFDCVWLLKYLTYEPTLLYVRKMHFSENNPIQAITNFENVKVEKVYWVDGKNQMRHLNIEHMISNGDLEALIDLPVNNTSMTSAYKLSQPIVSNILYGGNHTSGRIQYCYVLYKVNGSQTKLSPLSEIISLGTETGGGDVNEIVGAMPSVQIRNLDSDFTNIRVYSIKYTSYGQEPTVYLIYDAEINSEGSVNILDDGSFIQTVNIAEVAFSGSDVIIPRHITSKDSRLFIANYKEENFTVKLDTRAYSFTSSGGCHVYDNLRLNASGTNPTGDIRTISKLLFTDDYLDKHDSVNLAYTNHKYQANGISLGGEGKYLKYALVQTFENKPGNRYFKDGEFYRIGIKFYNKYGQSTETNWIADFKAPDGNLEGRFNILKFEFKSEFYQWLNNSLNFSNEYQVPVGYRIMIAERTLKDRTIIANGIVSGMMVNDKSPARRSDTFTWEKSDSLPKMPAFLTRNIDTVRNIAMLRPLYNHKHLQLMNTAYSADTEVMRANNSGDRVSDFWQYTSMMQMYSPEILFEGSPQTTPGLRFKVKGALRNTYNAAWLCEKNYENGSLIIDAKVIGGLTTHGTGNNLAVESFVGNPTSVADKGLFGHPGGSGANAGHIHLFYRKYGVEEPGRRYESDTEATRAMFYKGSNNTYNIYGTPQYAELGQSYTNYNNDFKYRFTNSLQSIMIDGDADEWKDDGTNSRRLSSANVFGQRCLVFVLGNDNLESRSRVRIENLLTADSALANNASDPMIYGEFYKSDSEIMLGGIYGGNSYEDKKRTRYYEIGEYKNFDNLPNVINSPGDTYVSNFKFIRMVRGDVNMENQAILQYEEIVEFLTETTVDLRNRNDVSVNAWDNNRVYLNQDYHKYNKVYSQLPSLFSTRNAEYNTKELNDYNTSIIATSLKQPGEIIDSWTNPLINDVMVLDGKYGQINSLSNLNNEIVAIQDTALAKIAVNPRVQIVGNDGVSIELGTGGVLHDYGYVTTTSGTLNKWSVIETPIGLLYFDTLNKDIMLLNQGITNLTEVKGLKSYFNNKEVLSGNTDNPLTSNGIVAGYSKDKNNVNMTFKLPSFNETITYNTILNEFTTFTDDKPKHYLNYTDYDLTVHDNLNDVYESNKGNFNEFYGEKKRSSLTLCVTPNADITTTLNNIMFKSETYLNGLDVMDKTLTHIRVYNEYQDSGEVEVTVGRRGNARRKFREWCLNLPRNKDSRERIKNPWNFIELIFENNDNYDFTLHDVTTGYDE